MQIFIITFIILTVLHPIGDYIIRNLTWDKWYCDLLHYLICLNPLHALWDETLGRKHGEYIIGGKMTRGLELIKNSWFWFWLGIDQLAHVILNLLLAVFLEVIF